VKKLILFLFVLTAVGQADAAVLSNSSLIGQYYVRHVEFTTDANNNVTDARSIFGSITFDGVGNYSVNAQQLIGNGSPQAGFIVSGTYSMSPSGAVALTNPQNNALTINARFGTEALIGSSTEAPGSTFDMFVAIPAPASGASPPYSDSTLAVNFHMVDLELTSASTSQVRASGMSAQFDGAGNIQTFLPLGHVASFNSGATQTGEEFTGTYAVNGTGSGTLTFVPVPGTTTASNLLLSGASRSLYVSATQNVFIAATPGAHDILIGIRNAATDSISFSGRYWVDRLELNAVPFNQVYVGSASVTSAFNEALLTARYHQLPVPPGFSALGNNTSSLAYQTLTDGFGGGCNCGIGSYGNVVTNGPSFVMAGTGGTILAVTPGVDATGTSSDTSSYLILFGMQIPTLTGPGVFLNPQGIVDSATYSPVGDYIAPGEFISMYGSGLANGTTTATMLPFPKTLGGVSVSINGTPTPVYYASPGLIICVVPYELSGLIATIVVDNNGTLSNPVTVGAALTSPGAFSANDLGFGDGAITHADNQNVNLTNPATIGETVQMYLAGLGALNTPVADGNGAIGIDDAGASPPIVLVDGKPAVVSYWGLTPDAGLYQINFTVPTGIPGGELPVTIATPNAVTATITVAIAATL
jgi:uncharacterized protein (TIGR03437 family)